MPSSRLPVGSSARSSAVARDRAGQRGPLRLALGELVRIGLGASGEADGLQAREGPRGDLGARGPEHAQDEGDVLVDGPVRAGAWRPGRRCRWRAGAAGSPDAGGS